MFDLKKKNFYYVNSDDTIVDLVNVEIVSNCYCSMCDCDEAIVRISKGNSEFSNHEMYLCETHLCEMLEKIKNCLSKKD